MTAPKCQAITKNGTPCQAYALDGSDYCFHHDPAQAARRRAARSKGGLARHGRHIGPVGQAEPVELDTMADVATLLRQAINDTLNLENSLQRARTIGYLSGLFIKALDMAALEQRVIALERTLESREDYE
ncbi:MAG: hypothetical protein KAX24_03560 [Anaerolineae bacterium]|nr:hypothetical protein [Anaerolineae bacterium]